MIKIQPLIHLVKLILLTGSIKDERPVSALLVAKPEAGKSEILKKFSHLTNVACLTDITAFGILRDIMPKIVEGKITHIVIPDLIKPLSRRESTVKNFITFLNALIEEGFIDIAIYFKRYQDAMQSGQKKVEIRCGLVSAITGDELFDRRHKWLQIGFMSRVLPISYQYSTMTRQEIMKFIMQSKHHQESQEKVVLPKKPVKIDISLKYCQDINPYTLQLATAQKLYGFRYQRQLQTLLKASALEDGRKGVTKTDLNKLMPLLEYVNLEFKII